MSQRDKLFGGWQPIETAPKDGTTVLAYWTKAESGYDKVGTAHCDDLGWDIGCWRCPDPQGWMPLPKPPEAHHGS